MKCQSSRKCRYAAHRLEFGRFCMRYPLIEIRENGEVEVDLFSGEIERVVFLSGTIRLFSQGLSSDESDKEDVSLDEMRSIIGRSGEIEVVLPGAFVGRP